MSSECEWASGLWISFSTGVRLDYSCHHFAQAGDVDLQIITEHENEQIDAAEEAVQGVVKAGLPQQYPQAPLWDVETIQGLYSP
jgi:hypothetical protein